MWDPDNGVFVKQTRDLEGYPQGQGHMMKEPKTRLTS